MPGRILFVFLFAFSFQCLHAQNFHAGLIGGLSTTQVAGDNLSGFNKAGIVAGGFVNIAVAEKAALEMEIIFIQKGSRMPTLTDYNNQFYVMRLSYFEVPVLVKWQIATKLNFELGPSVGALIFSEEETEYGVLGGTIPFKKIEFSGNIGLSYPLNEKLSLNARFSTSVLPIRDFPGVISNFFNSGQYNTVLTFTLHYQF